MPADAQTSAPAGSVVSPADRGGYFARLKPGRSYGIAFDVPAAITRPMFISAGSPTRSVRYAPVGDGGKLIVAGASHVVGRKSLTAELAELSSWARRHYPGAVVTHQWSAQDYTPADHLSYVGSILLGDEKAFVATGFNKWGLTAGVAAALVLSGRILGGRMDWSRAFAAWSPHELAGVATAVRANLEVAMHMAKGWLAPMTRLGRGVPADGDVVKGRIAIRAGRHTAGRTGCSGADPVVLPNLLTPNTRRPAMRQDRRCCLRG
jgi:hypothetical protein